MTQVYDFQLQRYVEHEHEEWKALERNIIGILEESERRLTKLEEQLAATDKLLFDVATKLSVISKEQSGQLLAIDSNIISGIKENNSLKKAIIMGQNGGIDAQNADIPLDVENEKTDIDINFNANV